MTATPLPLTRLIDELDFDGIVWTMRSDPRGTVVWARLPHSGQMATVQHRDRRQAVQALVDTVRRDKPGVDEGSSAV